MQHQAKHRSGGRHRRTDALHGRSSSASRGRNRNSVLTATLIAGVGLAGISTAERAQASPEPTAAPLTTIVTAAPLTSANASEHATELDAVVPLSPGSGRVLSWAAPTRKARVMAITAQWVNPLPEAAVTSCFGERWGRLHAGVDLATVEGTRIRAAGAGVVVAAGPAEGYGNAVLIDHGDGFLTHYGHMNTVLVKVGQQVEVGQQIGTEGSTGHSTGPHLHFEVHKGFYKNPVEPTAWLHEHGVDIPGCAPLATPAAPQDH